MILGFVRIAQWIIGNQRTLIGRAEITHLSGVGNSGGAVVKRKKTHLAANLGNIKIRTIRKNFSANKWY